MGHAAPAARRGAQPGLSVAPAAEALAAARRVWAARLAGDLRRLATAGSPAPAFARQVGHLQAHEARAWAAARRGAAGDAAAAAARTRRREREAGRAATAARRERALRAAVAAAGEQRGAAADAEALARGVGTLRAAAAAAAAAAARLGEHDALTRVGAAGGRWGGRAHAASLRAALAVAPVGCADGGV
jgi:hypothetical protein